MRIGHGYDVHQFEPGTGIQLAGINIPCDYSIKAHSDGDVVLHAICDALLGALALGDIGHFFPDDADENAGRDSAEFIRAVYAKVKQRGYRLNNVDVTIIAQTPKLAPHNQAMRTRTAELLETDVDNVSIKATTTEGMGYIGEKRGIATHAVVLLTKES